MARVLLIPTLLALCCATVLSGQDELDRQFTRRVRPLLAKYCGDCHSGDGAEAAFDIEQYATPLSVLEGRRRWKTAIQKLELKQMPPAEGEQPTAEERAEMAAWLRAAVDNFDCGGPSDPGRPTIRRLTRTEYRNTIRDLFGIDYEPAADFPADDVGYGFDNIGDVLSLPPLLMEKYLAAAEEIAGRVIVTDFAPPLTVRISAAELESKSDGGLRGDSRILTSTGEMHVRLEIPHAGRYELKVTAFGDQAGGEPVKMSLRIDDREVKVVEVKAERKRPGEYTFQPEFETPGRHKVAVAFLNDYYNPQSKNPDDRDRNLLVSQMEMSGPQGFRAELPEVHRRIVFAQPGGETTRGEAARLVVARLASRGWRRPVSEEEIQRLVRLADVAHEHGDNFETGVSLAVQAVLVSPNFLFKVEQPSGPGAEKGVRPLTDFELATNLSYFLWSSMPDDELLKTAFRGELQQGDHFQQQVRRMIADPKSRALVENFAVQWLQLRNLETAAPDGDKFPAFSDELRRAMLTETKLLFAEIIRQDRSILDLLTADFTFVNEPLARLYGVEGVSGDEFRRVSLKGTNRGGLLTQAGILTITSNPDRTSPVKRGKWILENLLNEPPPPPAPNVPELDNQRELTGTLRERMEQHRADPTCAACHQKMDPLGFALENFDAIGRFREREAGQPIDASGKLPGGEEFRGARELQEMLAGARRDEFARCFVEKLMTFALGRGIEHYDECAIRDIVAAAAQDGYRFSAIVEAVANSDPFRKRRVMEE